jgi:hypothetical protein
MDTIAPATPALPTELRHRRVRLELGPAAAAYASGHVRAAITAWSVPVNPAVAILLTSDLVINAVTNGAGETITLGIRWSSGQFRVEVHDASVSGDSWESADADADADRGLLLAAAMAADWGHYRTPAGRAAYYVLAPEQQANTNALGSAASHPAGLDRGLPPRDAAFGAGGCRPADLRGIGFHGRGLSGAAWAGSSSRGVYDRQVRCRLAFWSGIRRRSQGRGKRGPDTSGAGT